ncbi:hypothetical protein FHP25_35915 [Vineibacter terrae]|uniref:Uncharacterized protein n=1 Tax=Vineibacter terrae TaxID=2586908 RepID=A0A5C8P8Y1_9HYPH|nr:hypothetical protein [Vineibacter terrae]TXL70111.1 hypothetical protein FHP25_35915 [Vineibacter terrae]
MDWTQYIQKIERAMLRGEQSIEHEGKRVTFRTADEAMKLIAYARQQQAAAQNGGIAPSQSYAEFGRD